MSEIKIHKDGLKPEDVRSHRGYFGQRDGSVLEITNEDDGIALYSIPHPPGALEKIVDAIVSGKLRKRPIGK